MLYTAGDFELAMFHLLMPLANALSYFVFALDSNLTSAMPV